MNINDESVENNNPAVSSLLKELSQITPSEDFNQKLFSELQLSHSKAKKSRIISLYSSKTFIGSAAASLFVIITSYFAWQGLNTETTTSVVNEKSTVLQPSREPIAENVQMQENSKNDEAIVQNVRKAGNTTVSKNTVVNEETDIKEVTLPEAVVSAPIKEEVTTTNATSDINTPVQSKAMSRSIVIPKTVKDSSKLKDSLKIRKKTD